MGMLLKLTKALPIVIEDDFLLEERVLHVGGSVGLSLEKDRGIKIKR